MRGTEEKEVRREEGGERGGEIQRRDTKCEGQPQDGTEEVEELERSGSEEKTAAAARGGGRKNICLSGPRIFSS